MHTSSKGEWVWVCGGYSTHQPLGRYDRHVAYYNHSYSYRERAHMYGVLHHVPYHWKVNLARVEQDVRDRRKGDSQSL